MKSNMVKRFKQTELDEIVKILKNDGVISVPTDTVYGICARISTQKAHDKLVAIKNISNFTMNLFMAIGTY